MDVRTTWLALGLSLGMTPALHAQRITPAASSLFLTGERHQVGSASNLGPLSPGEKGALVGGAFGALAGAGLGYAFCRGMRESAGESCVGTTIGFGATLAVIGAVVGAFAAGDAKAAATP